MQVACYKCEVTTTLEVTFEVENFVCPNCSSLYSRNKTGELALERQFDARTSQCSLKVGMAGTLKGIEYTVTGILVKRIAGNFLWREYILQGKDGSFRYLSEADGHWILLEEIPEEFTINNRPKTLAYNDLVFDIYDYNDTYIVSAAGFFDFELPKTKVEMTDYINPPFLLSVETMNNVQTSFYGEHIGKNTVKKAFEPSSMPYQSGFGIVQPNFADTRKMGIVFCSAALLIFFTHLFVYNGRSAKSVLSAEIPFTAAAFVSDPFELKGGSAPLTVSLYSDVNNSWANVEVMLVNKTTNDEVYASKDIEYYYGNTDGENWSEGDHSEKFNICGVSEGKYQLVITPQKPPEDSANNSIKIEAVWNEPSMWNVWMPIIFMAVILFIAFFANKYFETKRWEDSNYSPYN